MTRHGKLWTAAFVAVLAVAALAAAACSSGVSQSDYDKVGQQLTQEQQKTTNLQQQLSQKVQDASQTQQLVQAKDQDLARLKDQVATKEKEVADLNKAAGAMQGVTPLIYTKVGPTPTPRPTPTPPPPGYVPPTPVPPDPATINKVHPFTFYVETVTGHQVTELIQNPACVPNSQFQRGTHLVWRFEVFDTSTGRQVTSLDTDAAIKVVLPNGETKTARYSKRGGVGPWMWAAAWDVPLDYPLGTLDYQIVATKGGRTGTFDQDEWALVVPKSATSAGEDSRLQIVP